MRPRRLPDAVERFDRLSRRRFVKAMVVAAASSPFLGKEQLSLAEVQAQSASNIGVFRMNLNSFPVLRNTFGSVRLRVSGMPTSFAEIIVTRVAGNQFFAVTSRCTHQGCTVGAYSSSIAAMECPCHGSRFGADGSNVRGPALAPLTRYVTRYDGADLLQIDIPGLGFRIQGQPVLVGANNTPRYRLSFPTVSGVRYEVRFRSSLSEGQWTQVPFSLTPMGTAGTTMLNGSGATVTLYVDRSTADGFYAVVRF